MTTNKSIDNLTNPIYKFETHSQATRFLCFYFIGMGEFSVEEPTCKNGVFSILDTDLIEGKRERMTVLDDKTVLIEDTIGGFTSYLKTDVVESILTNYPMYDK